MRVVTHQLARFEIVVVMGVSGAGKTTVAQGIAKELGWEFAEGDSFHPQTNIQKMASGTPLTDADRWPWLDRIGEWIDAMQVAGTSAVLTCSALRQAYRDRLRKNRPQVVFCELDADQQVLAERLAARRGHYMPPSLLPSQLATLEPLQPDEPGVHVRIADTEEAVVRNAIAALGLEPLLPEGS